MIRVAMVVLSRAAGKPRASGDDPTAQLRARKTAA